MDTDKREDSQQPQSYQTRQAAECLGPRRHSNADQDRRKQAEERHSQNHGNCVSEVCQDQRQYAEDCQQQNQLSHQQDAWPSKPVTTDTAEDETKDNADLKIHENEGSTLSFEMTKTPAITSGDAEEDEDDVIAWEPVPVAKTRWLKKKRREVSRSFGFCPWGIVLQVSLS